MKASYSPKQVARAIGVSEASIKRWCDRATLTSVRTAGGHRRIQSDAVIRFLRETGHPLVHPETLGLPSLVGKGSRTIERAGERLQSALELGNEDEFRGLAFSLFLSGWTIRGLCDELLAPAFKGIGDHWEHGSVEIYQERRACEICARWLHEVSLALPIASTDSPYAMGGTLSGDPYVLPSLMIEVALRESGWRAEAYGVGHPPETLTAAVRAKQPRLVWVSFSSIDVNVEFLSQWSRLAKTCTESGVFLVVGGRALTVEVRERLVFSAYCDRLSQLTAFCDTIRAAESSPQRSREAE